MHKLSVIVPIYNVAKYIVPCVRSLFAQTLDDIEYVFIDDCTQDNSIDLLQSVIKEYPHRASNVKIITHNINKGLSAARRTGLLAATGHYVISCDPDDYVEPVTYEQMYEKAINSSADIVACGIQVVDEDGTIINTMLFDEEGLGQSMLHCFSKVEGGIYSSLCNKMIRRDFLHAYSIYPDDRLVMWEDLYVTFRARFFADKIQIVNKPLYHYIMHCASIVHSTSSVLKLKSQVTCVKLIETFLRDQNSDKEYALLIAYLKIIAKKTILNKDNRLWVSTFPESTKYLYRLRGYFDDREYMKYLILGYGKALGCAVVKLLKVVSKIKAKFISVATPN